MKKPTRKEIVDALCDVLDSEDEFDIRRETGLPLKRCEEIIAIKNAVEKERLNL